MLFMFVCFLSFAACNEKKTDAAFPGRTTAVPDIAKQRATLEKIVNLLPPERTRMGRVSFLDSTIHDWLKRTGELPPDFDMMPSIPFLPDPLIIDEGGENIPVKTMAQWEKQREVLKSQLEYYITGTCPPPPDNLKWQIISEKKNGETSLRVVQLTFGPDNRAKLTLELLIPPGPGPFPVFLTMWNHREWAQVAVRRGYAGCLFSGADPFDDTEEYSEIWAGQYDFGRLMRRSYGASRAIDYLYTLAYIDKEKIAITGHSRNGDLSLIAAAFDERITAVVPVSGTGIEVPWRYAAKKYDIEDIGLLASGQPSWFQPRLRFFYGRENKLPVDNNTFLALIAPRGVMLSTALNEGAANPWGSEQAYFDALKVYKFIGAENNLAIRFRDGLHGLSARDMEDHIDFFDYVFKRSDHKPENRLHIDYSFEKWQMTSGEKINPMDYKDNAGYHLLSDEKGSVINSIPGWENKKSITKKHLKWALGDEPAGVYNQGPGKFTMGGRGENSFGTYLIRPEATPEMGVMTVNPYNGFGDQLFGYLYYPADKNGELKSKNLPVVIYLHEYDYSKGFNSYHQIEQIFQNIVSKGYVVFAFDMLGFGNRITEGTRFYERYPHWSKMGKMVTDVRGAIDALENMDFIDKSKIFVAGYSLGATVGLYAAALDERIAGAVTVAGFTPMRTGTVERGVEGVKAYSHLHGLLPKLGFFAGNESRIPYDFNDVLACIAPRPVLVIAPIMDKDALHEDVQNCVEEVREVYNLYNKPGNLQIYSPDDYNRFSDEMRTKTFEWLKDLNSLPFKGVIPNNL